jgi:hypothetical protein
MPNFTKMSAKDVQIGRGRLAAERRVPFIEALRAGDAGKIELERGDRPQVVKRVLAEAAKETGIKVRSSWEDKSQRVLLWKRTGK